MLRAHRVDGLPVAQAARQFGLSRQTFYQTQLAFAEQGMVGLLPERRGPKGPYKLTPEMVAFVQAEHRRQPERPVAELAEELGARFGVRVHPRTIRRALQKKKKGPTPRRARSPERSFFQATDRHQQAYETLRARVLAGEGVGRPQLGLRLAGGVHRPGTWVVISRPGRFRGWGGGREDPLSRLARILRWLLDVDGEDARPRTGGNAHASGPVRPGLLQSPGAGADHRIPAGCAADLCRRPRV